MPITIDADIRPLDQQEFSRVAYHVMHHAFSIHQDLGRLFDEDIYRDALAARLPGARTEVRIEVRFEDFVKDYFIDLLVDDGAAFELKAVRNIDDTHRAQILNYLMLAGLTHGKLMNFRSESVQHEFVNSHQTLMIRRRFQIDRQECSEPETRRGSLQSWFVRFVEDVGTGLDLNLYTAAVSHFCGNELIAQPIAIMDRGVTIGFQKADLAANGWAFRVTAVAVESMPPLKLHLSQFLNHTDLEGFHWINVTRDRVSFCTLTK